MEFVKIGFELLLDWKVKSKLQSKNLEYTPRNQHFPSIFGT
jgi:hypothetical protein